MHILHKSPYSKIKCVKYIEHEGHTRSLIILIYMPGNNAKRQAQTSARDVIFIMYLYHQVVFQHHRGDK